DEKCAAGCGNKENEDIGKVSWQVASHIMGCDPIGNSFQILQERIIKHGERPICRLQAVDFKPAAESKEKKRPYNYDSQRHKQFSVKTMPCRNLRCCT